MTTARSLHKGHGFTVGVGVCATAVVLVGVGTLVEVVSCAVEVVEAVVDDAPLLVVEVVTPIVVVACCVVDGRVVAIALVVLDGVVEAVVVCCVVRGRLVVVAGEVIGRVIVGTEVAITPDMEGFGVSLTTVEVSIVTVTEGRTLVGVGALNIAPSK
ncbi:MAG: hypothetical protein HXX08_14955 [Chloroflexi bacterium]|uniref:Uncharacterized protein n=1 Tax=Candidatus Chlorohelix allophototropha TaxID=3003348 RepID=A0A8T7M4Z0_9CHLR|nr:hypothetical protein [Chloroflexota bacterium]WJW69070.1 hypothetical protein OZ401_002663 [Chloroflexota bacterium L227-S17]